MLVQQKAYVLGSLFLLSFHPFYEVQFFFINRIFKNDLISDCLCALNHVAGPVHKQEGCGAEKPRGGGCHPSPCPATVVGGWRDREERGLSRSFPSGTSHKHALSGGALPVKRDPMCGKEPFQVMNENKQLHH